MTDVKSYKMITSEPFEAAQKLHRRWDHLPSCGADMKFVYVKSKYIYIY